MWTHKKYGKTKFKGSYLHLKGERVLVLSADGKKNQEFQSHQAAKSLGWKYVG